MTTEQSTEAAARGSLPRLILLHGTRMNGAQWTEVARALADLVEVVAPDLPGHGRRGGERFSLARVVDEVARLADEADARPVILAGYSLGGYAAMCYAEQHPQRLAGLALIGSAAEPVGLGAALYRLVGSCWGFMASSGMDWVDRCWFAQFSEPRTWQAIAARGGNFHEVRAAWDEVIERCRARQLLGVRCPVLIAGGNLDQLHMHAQHFAAAAMYPQVVTASGRSHLWPLTHPDEVAQVLRRWISETVLP